MSAARPGTHLRRLVRFGAVGVTATLVHVCTLTGLVELAGVDARLANVCAWLTALPVSYFGHYYLTWGADGPHRETGFRFVVTMLIALLTSQTSVWAADRLGLGLVWAIPAFLVVGPLASYAALHLLVFGRSASR